MILFLIGIVFTLLLVKAIENFSYWARHGVPNRPYPVFGWLWNPVDKFMMSVRTHHKIFGSFIMFKKTLKIQDPVIARNLSIKQLHDFPVRFSFHLGDSSLSKSLFFLDANEDWKRIRLLITPAFTSGKLKAMMDPINEISDEMIEKMKSFAETGEVFDVRPHVDSLTMQIIARCAFGIRLDAANHPIIVNAKKILNTDVSFQQALCVLAPPIARLFNLQFFDVEAVKYFDNLTEAIIAERKKSGKAYNDLIGLMMEAIDREKGHSMTARELSSQSILFFIAGYDTTNSAINHAIYYLSQNRKWQDKLYSELREAELEYDNLTQLPVLNAIIYETLRLKPSLAGFDRVAIRDCELLDTGIPVPKGTNISISPFMIHRDEEYFPDAETFNPERFVGTGLENSVAYMPFGTGNRLCVGMRFALNELRISLAKLFKNYTFELEKGFELEYFNGSGLLSPKKVRISISGR